LAAEAGNVKSYEVLYFSFVQRWKDKKQLLLGSSLGPHFPQVHFEGEGGARIQKHENGSHEDVIQCGVLSIMAQQCLNMRRSANQIIFSRAYH